MFGHFSVIFSHFSVTFQSLFSHFSVTLQSLFSHFFPLALSDAFDAFSLKTFEVIIISLRVFSYFSHPFYWMVFLVTMKQGPSFFACSALGRWNLHLSWVFLCHHYLFSWMILKCLARNLWAPHEIWKSAFLH